MKLQQSLWMHGIVLVVASGLAWKTWTREESPTTLVGDRVQVWNAKIEQLESLRYEIDKRTVEITPHRDESGRWYEVRIDKEIAVRPAKNIGAGGAPPEPETKRETKTFVSVTEGEKLAESLAPLTALRSVGRVEGDREKEFGFDEPAGTLVVRIAGKEHTVVLGGLTPGGADRYARIKETGEVFAISGDIVRRLEHAENRLLEREFHAFGEQEPNKVKIVAGDRSRELVRVEGKLGGWANAASPQEQDETASNWMGKLGKLRVRTYLEGTKELEGQSPVLQVEYLRDKKSVGFFELFKLSDASSTEDGSEGANNSDGRYVARSRHTRWPVEVPSSAAGEVERDLTSLFE